MSSKQTSSQGYDDAYFQNAIDNLPDEYKLAVEDTPPLKSYNPLTLSAPVPADRDLITVDKNGIPKGLNRLSLVTFLEDCHIIYVNRDFRKFDGRRYAPFSVDSMSDLLMNAIREHSFIPRDSDVQDFIKACRSLLKRDILMPSSYWNYEKYIDQPLIVFQNGIYNMDLHEMLPFTPHLPIYHYIRADFDPTVEDAPARAVIEDIIPDPATRSFLFQMIGYILFEPTMNPPAIFVLYGPTQTGKSALAMMIENLVGSDSVSHLNMKQLTSQFGPADIEGKLLNVCTEAGGESAVRTEFNGQLLKNMTSGEKITVEKKHKDAHEIIPTAKTLFCTNSPPDFGDDSSGILRRLFIIPCRQPQNPKNRIYNTLNQPDSLTWVVNQAYNAYLLMKANGDFIPSQQMENEKKFYKAQNSILDYLQTTFGTDKKLEIRDRIVNDPELCYTAVLHHSYKEFCDLTLAKPIGRKRFVEYIRNEYNLDVKNEGIYLADGRHTTRDRYVKMGM